MALRNFAAGIGRTIQSAASLPMRILHAVGSTRFDAKAFISGLAANRDTFGDFTSRLLRYQVYEAIWEGTIYRPAQQWSEDLKIEHDLYQHSRPIQSPGKRVVDFWGSKTYPGMLDLDAGDGKSKPSACPILTNRAELRPMIGQMWKDSAWQVNKDIFSQLGACHGDVFLQPVDDTAAGRVYFCVRDAKTVYEVKKDDRGNIVAYTVVEHRPDPDQDAELLVSKPWVLYVEECWKGEPTPDRDETPIHYRTSIVRNGTTDLYDWSEEKTGAEWTVPYGFVPMVHVQNRNIGKGWGWSVYHGSVDKLLEADDLASKLHDYIRKVVDAFFFLTGASPDDLRNLNPALFGELDPQAPEGRDDKGFLFGPENAKLHPMVVPMSIKDASAHLKQYDDVIVQDFPELMAEDVSPAASGESRRVAREKVEAEVIQHRSPYDAGLVTVHKQCLSIWILRGYDGVPAGFDSGSFRRGELDHSIGDRPVFAVSEIHKLESALKRADVLSRLVGGAVPLPVAMRLAGYSDAEVAQSEAVRRAEADDADAREARFEIPTIRVNDGA